MARSILRNSLSRVRRGIVIRHQRNVRERAVEGKLQRDCVWRFQRRRTIAAMTSATSTKAPRMYLLDESHDSGSIIELWKRAELPVWGDRSGIFDETSEAAFLGAPVIAEAGTDGPSIGFL